MTKPGAAAQDARTAKDQRINLRTSARQEQVIRRAAAATDRTLSDFILASAVQQAERVLADRRWFIATEEQWSEFVRLLEQPLPSTARFEALAARPSPFPPPTR
jgi:uncharacterized protein (DUF1778 family)